MEISNMRNSLGFNLLKIKLLVQGERLSPSETQTKKPLRHSLNFRRLFFLVFLVSSVTLDLSLNLILRFLNIRSLSTLRLHRSLT